MKWRDYSFRGLDTDGAAHHSRRFTGIGVRRSLCALAVSLCGCNLLVEAPTPPRPSLESPCAEAEPLLSGRRATTAGELRAGVGRASLLDGLDGPVQMATYGPLPGLSSGVRAPVEARALLLDNGSTRVAIVSCDLIIMDVELRRAVLANCRERGIEFDDLLLAATHTHTSVGGYVDHWLAEFYIVGTFQSELRAHLAARIADAIAGSASALTPARIGVGHGAADDLSFNRRYGKTIDPEVGVLKIEKASGEPLAVAVNFAAHPVLEPADGLLSSDYPGALVRRLDAKYGFGIFLQGALGDLNACSDLAPSAWLEEGLADRVADRLFDIVADVVETIETTPPGAAIELGSMTTLVEPPPANVNVLPDILFPLEWLLLRFVNWPVLVPQQVVRLGDLSIVACSTELGARLGRRIKRRSPARHTFVMSHSNGYAGYAVTQIAHPKSKIDPTSVMANNGARYGTWLVEMICDLLHVQWGTRIDPALLPPLSAHEAHELLLDGDITRPQTRRASGSLVSDSLDELVRLSAGIVWRNDVRTGNRVEGRLRDTTIDARIRLPLDVRIDATFGHRRSEWERRRGAHLRDSDDGPIDLAVGIERPWTVWRDTLDGNALRVIPRAALITPTGDPDPTVPIALATGTGAWRPRAGGALELTWETARVMTLETLFTTATNGSQGRRPGDTWDWALGYRERHGHVSLSLEWRTRLVWPDERRGGRNAVDVDERAWTMDLRPGLAVHLGESWELAVDGIFGFSKSNGLDAGEGLSVGVIWGGW